MPRFDDDQLNAPMPEEAVAIQRAIQETQPRLVIIDDPDDGPMLHLGNGPYAVRLDDDFGPAFRPVFGGPPRPRVIHLSEHDVYGALAHAPVPGGGPIEFVPVLNQDVDVLARTYAYRVAPINLIAARDPGFVFVREAQTALRLWAADYVRDVARDVPAGSTVFVAVGEATVADVTPADVDGIHLEVRVRIRTVGNPDVGNPDRVPDAL